MPRLCPASPPSRLTLIGVLRYQGIVFCVANDSGGNLELFIGRLHKNGLSNLAVFARIVLNSDKSRVNESVKCSRTLLYYCSYHASHTMKPSSYVTSNCQLNFEQAKNSVRTEYSVRTNRTRIGTDLYFERVASEKIKFVLYHQHKLVWLETLYCELCPKIRLRCTRNVIQ